MSAEGTRYLLDSSALFALIEDEPGADRVAEAVTAGGAVLSCLALLEVYYVTLQERGRAEADRRYAWLKQLPIEIAWEMDEPTLLIAARLKAGHRLSLADARSPPSPPAAVSSCCTRIRSSKLLPTRCGWRNCRTRRPVDG